MSSEVPAQTNGFDPSEASAKAASGAVNGSGKGADESPAHSKNEIGWYFVEQYYTNLSKNPDKLHLFYAKRSQFVSGVEAEKAQVHVGQRAISEGIKELNFQEAKVRITNVDSQESGRNIVSQVIGEMSIKGEPHRKFVQTFVLAEQPNGYYVLNDIFRYIADEDEEPIEEDVEQESAEAEPEAAVITNGKQEPDSEILEKKLEETLAEPEIEPAVVADITEPEAETEPVDEAKDVEEEKTATPEVAAKEVEEEEQQAVEEKPKDPEPTPAATSPVKQAAAPVSTPPAETPAPAKAAAPKTWASMLAGNKPVVAIPQVPAQIPTQPKSAPKAAPTTASDAISAPGAAAVVAGLAEDNQAPPSPGGWQTAGQDHNRKQHKQQPSTLGGQNDNAAAYIKNVTDAVDASILKHTLGKYGKLVYFDVSRGKNCAFVEFDSHNAFKGAMADNPHVINGVEVIVAERHRGANGFARGGGVRGGRGGMENRTNSQGGRGGFNKDNNGRGNYANRGARGGPQGQRGRGNAQAA